MTVITITTVGYGEVHPLTDTDKVFTSILIVSSIFIVGYAITVVTESILSNSNIGNLRQKRNQRMINQMK